MAESSYRRYYQQSEFAAMAPIPVNATQFLLHLTTVAFSQAPIDAYHVAEAIALVWEDLPTPADIALADAAVASYIESGAASDEPLQIESLAVTSATDATLVTVIDQTTPPRAAGTYQISWTSLIGMLATVANTGVRGVITLTRTQGASVVARTWEHNWNLQNPQTFSGCITFICQEGATLRARLQVAKIGASAATAQMAVARITADKIG